MRPRRSNDCGPHAHEAIEAYPLGECPISHRVHIAGCEHSGARESLLGVALP